MWWGNITWGTPLHTESAKASHCWWRRCWQSSFLGLILPFGAIGWSSAICTRCNQRLVKTRSQYKDFPVQYDVNAGAYNCPHCHRASQNHQAWFHGYTFTSAHQYHGNLPCESPFAKVKDFQISIKTITMLKSSSVIHKQYGRKRNQLRLWDGMAFSRTIPHISR